MLLMGMCPAEASNVADSLVVGIQSVKTSVIRPLEPLERDMLSIYNLVYESLLTVDDNYVPAPGLAESWEQTGNGRTWTFHLRSNLSFSDGTPLTSADVVATAQQILAMAQDESAQNRGYYQNLSYFVDSISAPDEKTVTVKAKSGRRYWGLLYAMTFPVLPWNRLADDSPPGSGPYMITSFSPGNSIWLEVNPYWWQARPQVEEISVVCHNTPNAVIESYEYARVDAAFTRVVSAAQYKSGTNSLTLDYRTNQLECLLMNHSSKLTGDIAIRRAIRCLVDVDRIASGVYMGMVSRTDTPMIAGTWMYNDGLTDYFRTDIEAARALLEEDGWSDYNEDGVLDRITEDGSTEKLSLRLYFYEEPDNDVRNATAELIKNMLAPAGIEVTVTALNFTEMQTRLSAGNFQLALASYATDVCPDPGYLLISGNPVNYSRYRSQAMNDLCKELRTQLDQASYQATLMKIQQQFAEDCPFICMFYRGGAVLTRRMYTVVRDVRELELLRGIASFHQ